MSHEHETRQRRSSQLSNFPIWKFTVDCEGGVYMLMSVHGTLEVKCSFAAFSGSLLLPACMIIEQAKR